jgi:histidinol-phosphate aminotransferase
MCTRVGPIRRIQVLWLIRLYSDYKDDGTNILLDANENAYGPGLALSNDGKLANGNGSDIQIDLLGLNRYPDP